MKRRLSLLLMFAGCSLLAAPVHAANWSSWRGPEENGVSRDRDLPDTWSIKPNAKNNNLLWTAPYGGSSTPIVQNGRIYFPGKYGDGVMQEERAVCLDEATGKLLHDFKSHVFLTDIVSDRIGWTVMAGDPTTGNVFVHFTSGLFYCLDKDLKPLWSRSMTEEYGRISGYGGRVTSPVVDGNLVILGLMNSVWGELAMGGCRWVAFDKNTGDVVWWCQTPYRPYDSYYSVPVVKVINGERVLVSGGGDGAVSAMQVRTGKLLWSFKMCNWSVNCSPVVDGNLVYIGHGEQNNDGTSGQVFCLDASKVENGKPKVVWKVNGITAKYASPALHEGLLYITNDGGVLYCLDAKTGKQLWTYVYGNESKGSPLWADGKIYVGEFSGRFHILQPTATGCTELHSQFFKGKGGVPVSIMGSPAAVNGHVYFMTSAAFYCLGKKDHKEAASAIPPGPQEPPVAKDAKPAWLQVVPADVTRTPGASQKFKAYAFDVHGRALGAVKVDWKPAPMLLPVWPVDMPKPPPPAPGAKGPPDLKGKVEPSNGTETTLTIAGPQPPLQFGELDIQFGDLKGHARIRVSPKLPFIADFSKVPLGRTPAGWVNTQGKYSMIEFQGRHVLKKRNDNPNPLVARVNAYIGAPNLSNYTIQSDVYGTKLRTDLPDMGVGANRYTLMLLGNTQELRVGDWDAQPLRAETNMAFKWEPDVWYRMKLTVTVKDGKAYVRGKVWQRDQKEPEKWTIEMVDPLPEKEGSPFLFGNATGAVNVKSPGTTIYYDNVKITPN